MKKKKAHAALVNFKLI